MSDSKENYHDQMARRQVRTASWNGDAPWWVKAIYQVGVPSAIAIFLVYQLTTTMPTRADVVTVKEQLGAHISSTEAELFQIRSLLFAMCLNAAAMNDTQRAACQAAGR